MFPEHRSQRGVGLIAAIFVIVILALLGTALIRIATTEQRAVTRSMASTQAFYAAETVRDWGLYQLIAQNNSNLTDPSLSPPLPNPANGLEVCSASKVGTTVLSGLEQFGTDPAPRGDQRLFRFRAVGVCYPELAQITSRRILEVRFSVP